MTTTLTGRPSRAPRNDLPRLRRTRVFTLPEMRWAAAATLLFLAGLLLRWTDGPWWAWGPLYGACYVCGGWEPALAGLRALRSRSLDVDLLMVVAALGAAAIGQSTDGALLIVIFATSGALEALATARTEDSVRGLLDLTPETATRVSGQGTSAPGPVPVAELTVGDVILVRPGERVGADGTVLEGASEVDQATITGEPLPADKEPGDEVFAGTMNGTGALWVRVDRSAGESVVSRIAALVEQAARTKARTQLFIEKVEQRYSVGVVVATLAIFAVPLGLGEPLTQALLRAMTFMIVASPCAVVLATMPPLLAAIANAGRHGVLVKSAVVMEQLGAATQVAFDKTGTLTEGTPEVAAIRTLSTDIDESRLLTLAASAEHPSEHPVAAAIVAAAAERDIPLRSAGAFSSVPGHGVTATVDGRQVQVGNPTYLLAADADTAPGVHAEARRVVADLAAEGHTTVAVLADAVPVGVLGISDRVRAEARDAVAAVTALTGRAPVLLTGDNAAAARRLAASVGIADVHAGLLPEQKVDVVRELQAAGRKVTVVGDGVNDAPALAAAHAGVAMGGAGSDLALQTADAVVIRDDLATIPAVIALSRRARRVVVANLVIAGTVIAGLVVWDLLGHLPLPLGVAGHEGSTVIVGLNGLRLLRGAAWRRAQSS